MSRAPETLDRDEFNAERLMADHPPIWRHPNKRVVYEVACPPGSIHHGRIHYSRWAAMPLPERTDAGAAARRVESRDGFFDYAPVPRAGGGVEWHVNFADPYLFVAYGSRLFAQDEMQVAEHPALGALLHTGFWGCGAFGGNRTLMALLQILAAEMAGVERLLFHTGGPRGTDDLNAAIDQINGKLATAPVVETQDLIDQVAALGLAWGVGDGN